MSNNENIVSVVGDFRFVHVRTLDKVTGESHRYVITPGQDYSGEPENVKDVCAENHTADIVAAYKDYVNSVKENGA